MVYLDVYVLVKTTLPDPYPSQQGMSFVCVFNNPFCVAHTIILWLSVCKMRLLLVSWSAIDQIRWLSIHAKVNPAIAQTFSGLGTCQAIPIAHMGADGGPTGRADQDAMGGAAGPEGWANDNTRGLATVPWRYEPIVGHNAGDGCGCGQIGEEACEGEDSCKGLLAEACTVIAATTNIVSRYPHSPTYSRVVQDPSLQDASGNFTPETDRQQDKGSEASIARGWSEHWHSMPRSSLDQGVVGCWLWNPST